jgi:hypothetical protein
MFLGLQICNNKSEDTKMTFNAKIKTFLKLQIVILAKLSFLEDDL